MELQHSTRILVQFGSEISQFLLRQGSGCWDKSGRS